MNLKEIIYEQSEVVAEFFKQELKNEIEEQGHKDTGKLIDSIEYEILMDSDAVYITFSYLFYGEILNNGVQPQNIPFGQSTGATTSKYIEALKDWAKRKGMKKPLSAAFAIAKTHKKEGMPTRGSYAFSENGRRKNWKTFTLESYLPQSLEIFAKSDLNALIDLILTAKN